MPASRWVRRPISSSSCRWASSLSRSSVCDGIRGRTALVRPTPTVAAAVPRSPSPSRAEFMYRRSQEVASRGAAAPAPQGSWEQAKGTRPHTEANRLRPLIRQALEDQEVAGALLREVDVEGERHQLPSLLTKVTEMSQEKEAIQPPVCARQIPYVHRVFDLRHGVPPPGSSIGWTPPSPSPRRPERLEGSRAPLGGRARKEGCGHAPGGAALPDRMVLGRGG